MVLASENGQLYHLILNNDEQKYYTYNLEVRFQKGDLELYKSGMKLLVDMCVDSSGGIIMLNRNKLSNDLTKSVYNYSIESFSLISNLNEKRLKFKETLFILNSEGRTTRKNEYYENNK